jgi:hypothetical protein
MPAFKVLYIKEFETNISSSSSKETDHNIIILYDETEGNFYYYGTRARETDNKQKYIEYSGSYSYDAYDNFCDFLKYLLDCNSCLITNELYEIHINKNEYANLSFSKIKGKFFKGALLSAYDLKPNNDMYLDTLLRMLITC